MTKEEAIKWLEYGKQGEMGKAVEAHDMAIQAIQALEDIRAEIEQAKTVEIKPDNGNTFKASVNYVINPQYRNFTSGLDIALQIIDKHMGKGEQDADSD